MEKPLEQETQGDKNAKSIKRKDIKNHDTTPFKRKMLEFGGVVRTSGGSEHQQEGQFLFKRKAQRMREKVGGNAGENKIEKYPVTPPEVEQSVHALEKGLRCDCYIKVKEGLIPAHSVLLCNARTINVAFASFAQESASMTFDMSSWNTELVLDVIEMLYTNSLEHIKPAQTDKVFKLFEMLVYLDHPSARKVLLSLMVSILLTLDILDETRFRCKHLDTAIEQQNLGMLYDSAGALDQRCSDAAFRVLWIVAEVKEIPALDEETEATFLDLFCRAIFSMATLNGESFDERTPEELAYLCSLSYDTISKVVDKCGRECLEYNWHAILVHIMQWISADPANRLEGLNIFKLFCFETIAEQTVQHFSNHALDLIYPALVHSDQKRMNEHLKEVEKVRDSEDNDTFSIMTPFTIYCLNNSKPPPSPSSTPSSSLPSSSSSISSIFPPSSSHASIQEESKKIEVEESQLKVFTFGVEMMMKWLTTVKALPRNQRPKACFIKEHVCSGFA